MVLKDKNGEVSVLTNERDLMQYLDYKIGGNFDEALDLLENVDVKEYNELETAYGDCLSEKLELENSYDSLEQEYKELEIKYKALLDKEEKQFNGIPLF